MSTLAYTGVELVNQNDVSDGWVWVLLVTPMLS